MLDLYDIRYWTFRIECEIEFDTRYSAFDLNVGLSLIFDIGHSKFECEIEFDIQYLTFDFVCWIEFDIRYSTFKI